MKQKLLFSLFIFSLFFSATAFGQDYSTSVDILAQTDDVLSVQSVGISLKKKEAESMAVRSAFYTLLCRGISGYNSGEPLIQRNNQYYVDRLLTERYMMFTRGVELVGIEETKTSPKKFVATVRMDIAIKPLIKDLVFEKLMEEPLTEVSMVETKSEVGLPSITVVPYKLDTETYKEVLQSDADLRMAVARVQEGFNKLGATTVDFEGRLEAMWRSREFNMSAAQSEEKLLLDNSGTDVYVTVDFIKDVDPQGNRASLNMKAYETASGNLLSSSVGWTNRFMTDDFDMLCVMAVEQQIDSFLQDLALNFAKTIKGGKSVVLRITRSEESAYNLESPIGSAGYALSNIIRRWVRAESQDGQYHIQGIVADQMIFDDIKIPSVDRDGLPMDAAQFGDNLLYYLNSELGVPCRMKIDGMTIHITLQ